MKCFGLLSSTYKGRSWGNAQATKTLSKMLAVEDQGANRAGSPESSPGLLLTCLPVFLILFCLDLIVLSQGHHSLWMRAHPNDLTSTCSPL